MTNKRLSYILSLSISALILGQTSSALAKSSQSSSKASSVTTREKNTLRQIKPVATFDVRKFGDMSRFQRVGKEYVLTTVGSASFFNASNPKSKPTRTLDLSVLPQVGSNTLAEFIAEIAPNKFLTNLYGFEEGVWSSGPKLTVYDASSKTSIDLSKKLVNCVKIQGEDICDPVSVGNIKVDGGRIYLAAGSAPNLFYTDDLGETWAVMNGKFPITSTSCYEASFLRTETHLIQGGECPLDVAFVKVYKFTDANRTKIDPIPVATIGHDFMGNRAAWHMLQNPVTKQVFAGVEGGLIELAGESYSPIFRIEHAMDEDLYPYYEGLSYVKSNPEKMLAWGNGQERGGTLMASTDSGRTWKDITASVIGGDIRALDIKDVFYDEENKRFLVTVFPVNPETKPGFPLPTKMYSVFEYKM